MQKEISIMNGETNWGTIIGIAGVLCGIVFSYIGYQKGLKTESKEQGEQKGILLTEIGYIKRGIDSIEKKQDAHDRRFSAIEEKIGRVDECAKSAHKRLDEHVINHRD
jgi:hypothetical protein